jgi:hypothetical protein
MFFSLKINANSEIFKHHPAPKMPINSYNTNSSTCPETNSSFARRCQVVFLFRSWLSRLREVLIEGLVAPWRGPSYQVWPGPKIFLAADITTKASLTIEKNKHGE